MRIIVDTMQFFIVSGPIGIGKTTFLVNLVNQMKSDFSIGGVLSIGRERKSFLNIQTGEKKEFISKGETAQEKIGKYSISKKALEFAENAIFESAQCEIIIIDEFGKLEAEKKGLFKDTSSLMKKIAKKDKIIIMCVRQENILKLENLLGIKPEKMWLLNRKPTQFFLNDVIKTIRNTKE